MSGARGMEIIGGEDAGEADGVEQSIPGRLSQMAAEHPSRMALFSSTWQATYGELDAAANGLAQILLSRGGGPGDRVALLMRHDTPQIAAAVAVLKAGRVLVVLNPSDPPARLRQVLDDSEPGVIVTDAVNRALAEQLARQSCGVVCFEERSPGPGDEPRILIEPGALAFLTYTSGSTGRPKGVMQTHCGVIDKVRRLNQGIGVRTDDRISLLASLSGGHGTALLWSTLLNGAAVYPFATMEKGVTGLAEWMRDSGITIYSSSASLFRHFVKTLEPQERFPRVRLVRLGSEPAMSDDFAAFQRHFERKCMFMHTMSASETGNITQLRLTGEDRGAAGKLPIGKAVEGVEVLLLDEDGREVAPGETGEIVVKSRYLSPGYWRQDELTGQRYSEAADGGGARCFRSGDLGRRDADGGITFLGRQDYQVKVRGYRIELAEIEEALARRPEVERAVVCARAGPGGDAQLAAYLVIRGGHKCDANALRLSLRDVLPIHMIPAGFICVDALPLTPHGKIDRAALARLAPPPPSRQVEEAATETESLLADIWTSVLNLSPIGRQDDFFDLGGDSLSAAVVAARLHAAMGVEVDLRVFIEHAKLADFAAVVDALQGMERSSTEPLSRAPRDRPLPLSFAQQRTWKYSRTPEEAAGYTVSYGHEIYGPLDAEVLRRSMDCIVRRHEILRTTFEEIEGGPRQIVHAAEPVKLPFVDLSGAADAAEQATRLLKEEARRPFDLARGPLVRFILVRMSREEHRLLRVSHHIITDIWSWKVYFRELAVCYEAISRGDAPPLAESMPLQFGDYAAWQQRVLHQKGPAYKEAVQWWSDYLRDAPPPPKLPFSRRRPREDAVAADGVIWWGLDRAVSQRLGELGREAGATFYVIRLAAFVSLLAYETGARDLVLGTYVTNRNRVEVLDMFGFFVNLATLRLNCNLRRTFREWVGVVRKIVGEIQARAEIPYEQLVEELQCGGVTPPEVRLIFGVSDLHAETNFAGIKITWQERRMENMPWGFTLTFDQHREETRCRAAFDARVCDPALVRRTIERFARFLDEVSRNPDRPMRKSHRRSR
jgi:amino acid adenylation domain-containing protein